MAGSYQSAKLGKRPKGGKGKAPAKAKPKQPSKKY